jgi:hypothetical protein
MAGKTKHRTDAIEQAWPNLSATAIFSKGH